jgi:hypothetical protein
MGDEKRQECGAIKVKWNFSGKDSLEHVRDKE